MSDISGSGGRRRRRRVDAERSRAAVLDAAATVLGQRPGAGLDEVARAAGVSRQTVYAHFANRQALLSAVLDRLSGQTVAALDAADLDDGPAAAALLRLVDVSWQAFDRYPVLLQADTAEDPQHSTRRHQPVLAHLGRLIERGQASGEFDPGVSPAWLVAATVALGHAAGEQVGLGQLSTTEAVDGLRTSLLRVYGVPTGTVR